MVDCYKRYSDEISEYLQAKLPKMPHHAAQEIADYITHKTIILVQDALRNQHNEVQAQINEARRAKYRKLAEYDRALREHKRKDVQTDD
jgi:predicted O-methyltransferase YrrM